MNRNYLLYLLIIAIITLGVSVALYSNINPTSAHSTHQPTDHSSDEFHTHADFLVVVNGTVLNFSQDKYMSGLHSNKHGYVHLHDGNGDVIHFHKENISLEEFFTSLDMKFNESCFVTDENKSYCENNQSSINMFVNGEENEEYEKYIAQDLDQILILVGDYTQEEEEFYINNVTNKACIDSNICKERIPEGYVGDSQGDGSCVTGSSCSVNLDFLND
ncbi:MAG: hypothetical protein ACLFPL_01150 [Candidatus Nanoarchaeia archaeon]